MSLNQSSDLSEVVDDVFLAGKKTVGTTEILMSVGVSNAENRQEVLIFNKSNATIYLGPTGVSISGASEGVPVEPQETFTQTLGPSLSLYAIAGTAGNEVVIWELG